MHGNNLSTLHQHLPTDILPAELGGTGPAFNPSLWAEPVIHSAMKEAELAAMNKQQEHVEINRHVQESTNYQDEADNTNSNYQKNNEEDIMMNVKTSFNSFDSPAKQSSEQTTIQADVELNVINKRSDNQQKEVTGFTISNENNLSDRLTNVERIDNGNVNETQHSDDRTDQRRSIYDLTFLDVEAEINSNEFEIISSRPDSQNSKDSSLDNRSGKAFINISNNEPSEETNLIT